MDAYKFFYKIFLLIKKEEQKKKNSMNARLLLNYNCDITPTLKQSEFFTLKLWYGIIVIRHYFPIGVIYILLHYFTCQNICIIIMNFQKEREIK